MEDLGYLSGEGSIVDVGSGTGLLAIRFLERGHAVHCVEPNPEMRAEAERLLGAFPGFVSVDATAESTGLPGASVKLIVAAQSFHWFEPRRTRREFARILRPGGACAIVWNARSLDSSPFAVDYERFLMQHAVDYASVRHRGITSDMSDTLDDFFQPFDAEQIVVGRVMQELDFEGLAGRLFSSSYMPGRGDARAAGILTALRHLFDLHQSAGTVCVAYDTRLFHGRLS